MRRRFLVPVALVLLALGIFLILLGYEYLICPIPSGSSGTGTCIMLDFRYVGPGIILAGLGILTLLYGLFVPRKSVTSGVTFEGH